MTRDDFLNSVFANEDQFTAAAFLYTHENYIETRGLIFHVPNGGKRNVVEAMKFKSMGLVPGEPDFVNMYGVPCGIELKMEHQRNLKNGGLSDDQMRVHAQWRKAGREVYVVYNAIEYLWILETKVLRREVQFVID